MVRACWCLPSSKYAQCTCYIFSCTMSNAHWAYKFLVEQSWFVLLVLLPDMMQWHPPPSYPMKTAFHPSNIFWKEIMQVCHKKYWYQILNGRFVLSAEQIFLKLDSSPLVLDILFVLHATWYGRKWSGSLPGPSYLLMKSANSVKSRKWQPRLRERVIQ